MSNCLRPACLLKPCVPFLLRQTVFSVSWKRSSSISFVSFFLYDPVCLSVPEFAYFLELYFCLLVWSPAVDPFWLRTSHSISAESFIHSLYLILVYTCVYVSQIFATGVDHSCFYLCIPGFLSLTITWTSKKMERTPSWSNGIKIKTCPQKLKENVYAVCILCNYIVLCTLYLVETNVCTIVHVSVSIQLNLSTCVY